MPYITGNPFPVEIDSIYGASLYGESLYDDYWIYNEPQFILINNAFDIKGITIVIKDFSGYVLYKFSNTGDNFPINFIQFGNNLEKGCSSAEFTLLEDIEKYGFYPEPYASYVEFYFFRSTIPFWVGEITDSPAEISSEKNYKFKAEGFSNRLEQIKMDLNLTVSTEISALIISQIVPLIQDSIPQVKINYSKIVNTGAYVNNLEYKKEAVPTVLKKLAETAVNYYYGIDENLDFFFMPKNAIINPLCVFMIGRNALDINVKKSRGKILNRYYINKKNTDGTVTYILAGTIDQITSQNIYGKRADSLTIPDNTDDQEAIAYATMLLNYSAFPSLSATVKGIDALTFSEKLLKPDGQFLRVFSKEKNHLDLVPEFKQLAFWNTNDNVNLTIFQEPLESSNSHIQGGSIRINGTTSSFDKEVTFNFAEPENYLSKISISFWVKSSINGQFLKLLFGDDINGYSEYPFSIISLNAWERITINIQSHPTLSAITKLKFKVTNASQAFQIYIDQLENFYYGVKKYEVEMNEIIYVFQKGEYSIEIEAGTPEIPFVSDFIKVAQKIKVIEACSKK